MRTIATARGLYADAATIVHTSWIYRRDRNPWPWILPLAVVAAFLVG